MFRLCVFIVVGVVLGTVLGSLARADSMLGHPNSCPAIPSVGGPAISTPSLNLTEVCHAGYDAVVDDDAKVPRWVAYELTGPHTLGCLQRKNNFHVDGALPDGSASPADYSKSGYDKGHQAPAEDFAWSAAEMSDSFSMANMAPQVGGLNRQLWERLEETVRAWAYERGAVAVYTGPDLSGSTKKIGKDDVLVPTAFWKVVIDEKTGDEIAFYMANKAAPKGDLAPFAVPVGDITTKTSVALPAANQTSAMWPVDLPAWRRVHTAKCRK
jgi:endonuclease G